MAHRRVNSDTADPNNRNTIKKAYEFALNHIGQDKDSGDIWRDYIDFIKEGEVCLDRFVMAKQSHKLPVDSDYLGSTAKNGRPAKYLPSRCGDPT
jgi:hypothetical protein